MHDFLSVWSLLGLLVLPATSASRLAAQGSIPAPLHRVSPVTAPERIVYEVFTAEILAHERQSNNPSLPVERRKEIGRILQAHIGLNDADFAMLKTIATRLHSDLDANARQGEAAMRNAALTTEQRAASINALRDARNDALDLAIGKWRSWMGTRFRWADDRIRAHVAPGLSVGPEPVASSEQRRGGPQ